MYRSIWTPTNGKVLVCARETGNRHDPFSVKVIKSATIVAQKDKFNLFAVFAHGWKYLL